jgi:uncharacterized membrane protein YphA (DoxX/SURF4 family)
MQDRRVNQVWWMLRAVFGVIPIVAGLDKFFNLLTNWEQYLSPLVLRLSPLSAPGLMRIVGIVEIAVGVMILTRWTRVGAYVASAWLAMIALNLLSTGHFLDVAARDVALAVAAFGLARLEEARAGAPVRTTQQPAGVPRPAHV